MTRPRLAGAAALLFTLPVALAAGARAGGPRPADGVLAPAPDAIARSLFLIGDAGNPARRGEPVLAALRRDVLALPARTTVVFLGDNLYDRGLPAPGHSDRAEMERRIDAQVDAVRTTGAHVVFIPGNHDWDAGGPDGWAAIRRQQQRVEERGGPNVAFLPRDGCPGPEVVDEGERLRLVVLDTQWWLHGYQKPGDPVSGCAADSEQEVTAALRSALEQAGARDAVVVMHHPLVSGGPHAGRFGPKQHLFPLTELRKWAWLPLPIVGSAYPIARSSGISPQDQGSGAYERMRERLFEAAKGHPPLAWASGHEHVLEVIESVRFGRVLVSGAGIHGHVTYVRGVEGARYQAARSGYVRIDFLGDGSRRLAVVEVAQDGAACEAYSSLLR